MYICYDKLWRLISEKKISKTELAALTGLSSRTLAKLSKNETVTTDTLLKICVVLECDLSDIAEVSREKNIPSFYDVFKRSAVLFGEDEYCRIYKLEYMDIEYTIKRTKKNANKKTVIYCENDSVVWEQIYPLGRKPVSVKTVISKRNFSQNGERTIFLVSGTPMGFVGLDENGFVSVKGCSKHTDDLYIMSYAALKSFVPKK